MISLKVLIEKLLHSCPEIETIYLLIRGAKGKSARERMLEMVAKKPFNIRLQHDFILKKVIAIESDLAEERLGLNENDLNMLAQRVSVIFHVAASVKFEAPLEVNMKHNVCATKELLEIASNHFRKLECFVHVSTAYSNCQLLQIDERIYPMDVPEDPMKLQVTQEMIDNRPNTYTYTKAMAENVASKYADRINVVIVRPSIVMSSMNEPHAGWVDTINGPVGLSVLGALGILQKIKVNSEVVFDLIPVDIVTNALVSIAWAASERRAEFKAGSEPIQGCAKRASKLPIKMLTGPGTALSVSAADLANNNTMASSNNNNIQACEKSTSFSSRFSCRPSSGSTNVTPPDGVVRVFNLTTGTENPCSFYHYFKVGREEAYKKPSVNALRPLLTIPKQKGMNPIQYWIHKIFSHLLFAYIIDTLLFLFGHKMMVVKAVKRMHHANEMFDYFCSNQWNFDTFNVRKLRELQTQGDQSTFNCDVRAINWKSYAEVGWLGCRRFILKEDDDSIDYAKRRYRKICLAYYSTKGALILACSYLIATCISSPPMMFLILLPLYGIIYLL